MLRRKLGSQRARWDAHTSFILPMCQLYVSRMLRTSNQLLHISDMLHLDDVIAICEPAGLLFHYLATIG